MSPGWVEGNHRFRESRGLLPAPTERSEDLGLDMGAGVNGRSAQQGLSALLLSSKMDGRAV